MRAVQFLLLIIIFQGCLQFEKDERLLAEHKKSNNESIRIYYVGLGATTNDVIQVRKIFDQKDELLQVFEKYNYLKSSKLLDDTTLQLLLSDTGYHNYNNKVDTILVNIKSKHR